MTQIQVTAMQCEKKKNEGSWERSYGRKTPSLTSVKNRIFPGLTSADIGLSDIRYPLFITSSCSTCSAYFHPRQHTDHQKPEL